MENSEIQDILKKIQKKEAQKREENKEQIDQNQNKQTEEKKTENLKEEKEFHFWDNAKQIDNKNIIVDMDKKRDDKKEESSKTIPPTLQDYGPEVDRKDIPGIEKDKGNDEYKKKNYKKALKHYSFCALAINIILKDGLITDIKEIENLSAKVQVLEMDKDNVKALYRRAKANIELGEFKKSKQDLKSIFKTIPQHKEAIKLFKKLKIRELEAKKKMKQRSNEILQNMNYAEQIETEINRNKPELGNDSYFSVSGVLSALMSPFSYIWNKLCKRKKSD